MKQFNVDIIEGDCTVDFLEPININPTSTIISSREALVLYKDEVQFTEEALLHLGDLYQL